MSIYTLIDGTSSRGLSLYYEPFEKGLGLFDDFPEEPVYLDHFSDSLAIRFSNALKATISRKDRLWHINTRYGQLANCLVVNFLYKLSSCGFSYKRMSAEQLRVLGQWHTKHKFANLLEKDVNPIPFIKETRLQLKTEAILKALPTSKMILIARHPYPVIKSTTHWFRTDRLLN